MATCSRPSGRVASPLSRTRSRVHERGHSAEIGNRTAGRRDRYRDGPKLLAAGGIRLSVEGTPVEPGHALTYKGLMLSDVPNCAICVGYTNASWTLRADLSSAYVCRLLNYMERSAYKQCVAQVDAATVEPQPLLGLNSGYVRRGIDLFSETGHEVTVAFSAELSSSTCWP